MESLRSVIVDGQLTIPGHEGTWHRTEKGTPFTPSLRINFDQLAFYRDTHIRDGKVSRVMQISGVGTIFGSKLALAAGGDGYTNNV